MVKNQFLLAIVVMATFLTTSVYASQCVECHTDIEKLKAIGFDPNEYSEDEGDYYMYPDNIIKLWLSLLCLAASTNTCMWFCSDCF